VLATADDERDITSDMMELAMVELNVTKKSLIPVKIRYAPCTTSQFNFNNHELNTKATELPIYDKTRRLDTACVF
jgi:hypothetical protein